MKARFRPAPGVSWVVGPRGTVLYKGREHVELAYPEAALWDLATRVTGAELLASMMAAVAAVDLAASRSLVERTLARWADEGWLSRNDGNGESVTDAQV